MLKITQVLLDMGDLNMSNPAFSSIWTAREDLDQGEILRVLACGNNAHSKQVWGEAYGNATPMQAHVEYQHVLTNGLAHFHDTTMAYVPTVPLLVSTKLNFPPAQEHPYFYIGIYAAIALSTGVINITGAVTQYTGALRASRILFDKLLRTVVRATMRWHDITPQGRMLNRFSKVSISLSDDPLIPDRL